MIPKLTNITPAQTHYLAFFEALKKSAFEGDISPDYANRTVLATDNSVYQILPQGVVYPKHQDDLVVLTQLIHSAEFHDITLSPRGGGTGTNGQSLSDGIIVDLSRHMTNIIHINPEEGWVEVETGVVKDQLNAALKPHGLFFAPELSTSNRATLGGMINTDASGQGSCLYGKTRNHVLELETVLTDSSVIKSQRVNNTEFDRISQGNTKEAELYRTVDGIYQTHKAAIEETFPPLNRCLTGYDLAHIREENGEFNLNNILCGSEGTLGFITKAKLNVLPIPKHVSLVVVKYGNFDSSLRDATELMKAGPTSIETIDSKVLNLAMNDFIWSQVEDFFPDDTSVPVQGINFVEYAGENEQDVAEQVKRLTDTLAVSIHDNQAAPIGFAVAKGQSNVNKIWAMRKRAVGLLGNKQGEARPIPFVEDTAVPPESLADFIGEFRAILDSYNLDYGMFGHVDAGVLHVRPALDMKEPEQAKMAWAISDQVASLTQKYNGLLWGEHGKGVRSSYAPAFFGDLYLQLQNIKALFDPHNQLNPGKIATPNAQINLLQIDEVPTRGQEDAIISKENWTTFEEAVYCNGNGACFNWNFYDAMCPSYKATRKRTHSPKGRASLIREWLKLLSERTYDTESALNQKTNILSGLFDLPQKLINTISKKQGDYDYSHEVYDSMSACLACKSCTGQCPIKVDVPEFRSKFLALYHTRYLRPAKDYLVGALEFMLPTCSKLPTLYNSVMGNSAVQKILAKTVGFVDGPLLTGIKLEGYRIALEDNRTDTITLASETLIASLSDAEKAKTVVVVQDAFTSYFETPLVIDAITLLKKLSLNVYLAPYKANGKPLHVHGFLNKFKRVAGANSTMLKKYEQYGVSLVGIDPSMTLTYRGEYAKYLDEKALPNVQLLQEFMAKQCEQHITKRTQANPITFSLLPHCTESSNATATIKLWQQIFDHLGHKLNVLSAGCCGMSGTFGHEAKNKETSSHLFAKSWAEHINDADNPEHLLATGYSCRSQVKREAHVTITHPMQALLKAL